MNYVFYGTPDFAALVLKKFISRSFLPSLVVCNPDRPQGRKKIVTPPPTKVLAAAHDISVWQPEKLMLDGLKEATRNKGIDLAIVAAYNKILPPEVLNYPKHGTLGIHPSLLPKYRGPTPIQTAILNGENKNGATIYLLDAEVDHGPILANGKWQMANGVTYEKLLKELAELGGDLLVETLPKFLNGEIKPMPQNEAEATYTKKFKSEDGYVDLVKDDPEMIDRKIRALNPEPGVWTLQNGKRLKLLETEIKDGKLILKKTQLEGEKPKLVSE